MFIHQTAPWYSSNITQCGSGDGTDSPKVCDLQVTARFPDHFVYRLHHNSETQSPPVCKLKCSYFAEAFSAQLTKPRYIVFKNCFQSPYAASTKMADWICRVNTNNLRRRSRMEWDLAKTGPGQNPMDRRRAPEVQVVFIFKLLGNESKDSSRYGIKMQLDPNLRQGEVDISSLLNSD